LKGGGTGGGNHLAAAPASPWGGGNKELNLVFDRGRQEKRSTASQEGRKEQERRADVESGRGADERVIGEARKTTRHRRATRRKNRAWFDIGRARKIRGKNGAMKGRKLKKDRTVVEKKKRGAVRKVR